MAARGSVDGRLRRHLGQTHSTLSVAGTVAMDGALGCVVSMLERELALPLLPFERVRYSRLVRAHADTHPAAFAASAERGRGMSVNDIYAEALAGR